MSKPHHISLRIETLKFIQHGHVSTEVISKSSKKIKLLSYENYGGNHTGIEANVIVCSLNNEGLNVMPISGITKSQLPLNGKNGKLFSEYFDKNYDTKTKKLNVMAVFSSTGSGPKRSLYAIKNKKKKGFSISKSVKEELLVGTGYREAFEDYGEIIKNNGRSKKVNSSGKMVDVKLLDNSPKSTKGWETHVNKLINKLEASNYDKFMMKLNEHFEDENKTWDLDRSTFPIIYKLATTLISKDYFTGKKVRSAKTKKFSIDDLTKLTSLLEQSYQIKNTPVSINIGTFPQIEHGGGGDEYIEKGGEIGDYETWTNIFHSFIIKEKKMVD